MKVLRTSTDAGWIIIGEGADGHRPIVAGEPTARTHQQTTRYRRQHARVQHTTPYSTSGVQEPVFSFRLPFGFTGQTRNAAKAYQRRYAP